MEAICAATGMARTEGSPFRSHGPRRTIPHVTPKDNWNPALKRIRGENQSNRIAAAASALNVLFFRFISAAACIMQAIINVRCIDMGKPGRKRYKNNRHRANILHIPFLFRKGPKRSRCSAAARMIPPCVPDTENK